MNFIDINEDYIELYNKSVNHPLQSFEWGEFRKKTNVNVIRRGELKSDEIHNPYQITVHQTPGFPYQIGYFPKGELPSNDLLTELEEIGKSKKISFIQLEPNIEKGEWSIASKNLTPSFHPLFTRYNFVLNLENTEDELLKNMHQKTRYNVRLAEKKGVKVEIDNSNNAFKDYLRLTKETTKRQKFYAHNEDYHKKMWDTFGNKNNEKFDPNKLQANLLKATYEGKTLTTWILFTFKDTLYYPYGASSDENREVMSSSLVMWEAIKYGKKLNLKQFDMWGAANTPDPSPNNPYYGFHRFKQGFGAHLTEYMGSYDFVINPVNYRLLTIADKLRWTLLKLKASK